LLIVWSERVLLNFSVRPGGRKLQMSLVGYKHWTLYGLVPARIGLGPSQREGNYEAANNIVKDAALSGFSRRLYDKDIDLGFGFLGLGSFTPSAESSACGQP
jgi:hypothetical protein